MEGNPSSRLVTVNFPGHHQFLIGGLWSFFRGQHGTDFELSWGERFLRVHRLVLDIFLSPEKLDRLCQRQFQLSSTLDDSHLLDTILEFLYNGTVSISECLLDDISKVATELDLVMLVEAVEAARHITQENTATPTNETTTVLRRKKKKAKLTKRRVSHRLKLKPPAETDPTNDSISVDEPEAVDRLNLSSANDRPSSPLVADERPNSSPGADYIDYFKNDSFDEAMAHITIEQEEEEDVLDLTHDKCNNPSEIMPTSRRRSGRSTGTTSTTSSLTEKAQFKRAPKRCPHCNDVSSLTYRHYYAHLRAAHGLNAKGQKIEPPAAQSCNQCSYTCKTRAEMKYHTADKHGDGANRLHCERCAFSTGRKSDLVKHVQVAHFDIRKFMCETCGYRAVSSTKLNLHSRIHNGEKPYSCALCKKAFADSSTYRRHTQTHEKSRQYVCHECGRAFGRQDNLNTHLKLGHRTYTCTLCPFESNGRGEVTRHVKETHPNGKPFTCDMCEYRSSSRLELKRHFRKHSGEKPFACKLCGASYGYRTTLRRHVQRHLTDAKPFSCNICGHSFSVKYSLNAHMKHVHKQAPTINLNVPLVS